MTEEKFISELEIFRREAEEASQCFYANAAIHSVARQRHEVEEYLNRTPLFWITCANSLQTASIIALGRIFDTNSPHNLGVLINLVQKNREMFSKVSLLKRKHASQRLPVAANVYEEFVARAHEPTVKDLRRLRRHVTKYRKIYERNYSDVRHKWFAHRNVVDSEQVGELFAKTNTRELQKVFDFLNNLHETLWELFYNGRKPVLARHRYSLNRMRKSLASPGRERAMDRIVQEAELVLVGAAKAKPTPIVTLIRKRQAAARQRKLQSQKRFKRAVEEKIGRSLPTAGGPTSRTNR